VLDMDYRPYGWANAAEASVYLRMACAMSDIVIGNREEFDVLEGLEPAPVRDPEASARKLFDGVTQAIVVKDGARGCRIFHRDGTVIEQGIFAVRTRKPFGSGDAFAGALLWGLFEGRPWGEAARLGAAGAAINVSGDACAEAMATEPQLMAFIAQHGAPIPNSRAQPLSSTQDSLERSR
jgi:5-dehydro-2-deoxygluconokinase